MSPSDTLQSTLSQTADDTDVAVRAASTDLQTDPAGSFEIGELIGRVGDRISPVWPLSDYVAVNPYKGFADHEFLNARHALRLVSDIETLMPVDYYREQFAAGTLTRDDISAAVDELVADGVDGAERIDVNQVVNLLNEKGATGPTADAEFTKSVSIDRSLHALTELIDTEYGTHWSRLVLEEIARHCGSHYDRGQAMWANPWKDLPLYEAWRAAAKHDRGIEVLGVSHFRSLVAALPSDVEAALAALLTRLGIPQELWESYLLCEALAMPGWSAWARFEENEAEKNGSSCDTFAALLTIRLTYSTAIAEHLRHSVDWSSAARIYKQAAAQTPHPTDEELLRYALLRAAEIGFRNKVLGGVAGSQVGSADESETARSLAQMVFCIDVRSERIRRHLEATAGNVQTYGFAGFFGLPIEFVPLGNESGASQVPVLISPAFKVHEDVKTDDHDERKSALSRHSLSQSLLEGWKSFQSSAVSCFAFVETTGLFYGFKLAKRLFSKTRRATAHHKCDSAHSCGELRPSLNGLEEQGVCSGSQVEMAASVLRGIGIVDDFARLVVLCGHGSHVENNPLQAGLDCGACGGHSGKPNAQFAAQLLNQPSVRSGLAEHGIQIPEDTAFVAALHNTTTDEIEFLDAELVPASHKSDLDELKQHSTAASRLTRQERLNQLPGRGEDDLFRRSQDWSEVRPEWGLAGNASFVAAPRSATKSFSLAGRSFLHSYDYTLDPGFAVLEQIMTAPLVVANWINMQYYASTVDPIHFGSGNKTVHNVIGRFGVVSGNGGDLMTGLPWQSVHDGRQYQHHPLRLLAVIAAPRQAIEEILSKNDGVAQLIVNGWVQLVALEDGEQYRFTEQRAWEKLTEGVDQSAAASA